MKKILTIILFLIFYLGSNAFCQYNDSTHYHFNYGSTGSINKTQNNNAYLLNNSLKFGVQKKRITANLSGSWIYGKQNSKLSNNDFSTALDFNWHSSLPRLYYWGLANYNTSVSLKINNQLLTGLGVAYNLIDRPNQKLNISDGILFDKSDLLLTGDIREIYSTFRNSFRLWFKFTMWELVTLESTSFIQHSLNHPDDYILRSANGLSIKLNNWLSFNTSYNYNRIDRTKRENMLLSYGLKIDKYF